jgi:hypothetical protein
MLRRDSSISASCVQASELLDPACLFLKYRLMFVHMLRPISRSTQRLPMRGWRIRRMGVAGLGLFALSLQLFLSFGHVHVRQFIASSATADGSVAHAAASKSTAPTQDQTPSKLPDDDCPICATMYLTASGLLPAPPCVSVSLSVSQVSHQTVIEVFDSHVGRHVLFQTRAPPIA